MRSAKQLKEYFTEKGLTSFPQTDKGNASFTESWLSTNEPGRRIVEFRKTSNLLNSFVMPLIGEHVHKGRVHTTYHQMRGDEFGTVTGRLSSTHPNLQQVPKRNYALGIPLRSVFVPDSGRRWLSVDWSQAEPRLLAYYGNVATLINGYKADPPLDAHSSVANAAGIDRQSGKRLNQGLITGMGTKKAMAELVAAGKSVSEAQDILDKYFAAMPELKSLQRRAADVMKKRGYVISLMGRRSNLEQPGLEYKAVNRLLQCSNADMIKYSMVRIHEEFGSDPDVEMLVNIHDSLDFQVAPGAEAKAQRCLDIMRDVPKVKEMLPVEVDSDWGDNWAQASYSKKDYDNRMKEVFGG
jgi:DNA polymerase-1